MTNVIVGVSDCQVSMHADATLVTYALGSCIGLTVYDPQKKAAGMLHYMLPDSSIDPEKASRNPWMFADTGIPLLFQRLFALGAEKRKLVVRAAGGAQVMNDAGIFNIGKRNHTALRKILWKLGVLIEEEQVGGSQSRTVRIEVGSGRYSVR